MFPSPFRPFSSQVETLCLSQFSGRPSKVKALAAQTLIGLLSIGPTKSNMNRKQSSGQGQDKKSMTLLDPEVFIFKVSNGMDQVLNPLFSVIEEVSTSTFPRKELAKDLYYSLSDDTKGNKDDQRGYLVHLPGRIKELKNLFDLLNEFLTHSFPHSIRLNISRILRVCFRILNVTILSRRNPQSLKKEFEVLKVSLTELYPMATHSLQLLVET